MPAIFAMNPMNAMKPPLMKSLLARQLVPQVSVYAMTIICYLALLLVSALALTGCSETNSTAKMPSVQFTTLSGKTFNTDSLKGQVTLVNFWATSCTTCVKEMPMMVDTFNAYSAKGYRMVAVAMDYDTPAFVSNFAQSRQLPFDVVHDQNGSIAKAFDGTKLTPTSYLIDKQGRIAKRYVGEPKHAEFKAAIEALLTS
jgi:peroxiredoxin